MNSTQRMLTALLLAASAALGCQPGPGAQPFPTGTVIPPGHCNQGNPTMVEVGVPDQVTFLDYESLAAGGDIPLSSFGQGTLTVQIALRGNDIPLIADVTLAVTLASDGTMGEVTETVELVCRSDGNRYIVPFVLDSADLGDPLVIQDAEVDVDVTIHDPDDADFEAIASNTGFLRRLSQ